MTYYSHTPVPNTTTQLTSSTAGVVKRPSKLTPAERLYHPPQSPLRSPAHELEPKKRQGQPHISPIANPRYLGAPSLSSLSPAGASQKRPESPLPPLPQLAVTSAPLPNALLPGGIRHKKNGSPLSLQQVLSDPYVSPSTNLPSTLQPGIQTGRRIPSDGSNTPRTSSTFLPQAPQATPYGYPAEPGPGSPALPPPGQVASINATAALTVPYPPPQSSTSLPQAPQAVPYGYPAEPGPGAPALPPPGQVASINATAVPLTVPYPPPQSPTSLPQAVPYRYPGPGSLALSSPGQLAGMNATAVPPIVPYPPPTSMPPFWAGGERARPVTFPIAMTPAPREVNSSYSILERPVAIPPAANQLPDPYLQARYQTPLPLPPGHSDNQSHSRQSSSQQVRRVSPDRVRIEAIRLAEEEAARRKEQADKDLELALQLDRELNVG